MAAKKGKVTYYRVVHGFVRDENEPGEMSIVEGDTVKRSPEEGVGEDGGYGRDGWALVQSLRTGEIGFVPAVSE